MSLFSNQTWKPLLGLVVGFGLGLTIGGFFKVSLLLALATGLLVLLLLLLRVYKQLPKVPQDLPPRPIRRHRRDEC